MGRLVRAGSWSEGRPPFPRCRFLRPVVFARLFPFLALRGAHSVSLPSSPLVSMPASEGTFRLCALPVCVSVSLRSSVCWLVCGPVRTFVGRFRGRTSRGDVPRVWRVLPVMQVEARAPVCASSEGSLLLEVMVGGRAFPFVSPQGCQRGVPAFVRAWGATFAHPCVPVVHGFSGVSVPWVPQRPLWVVLSY